jgi:hypothetical protein
MIHITYVIHDEVYDHLRFRRWASAKKWIKVLIKRGAHSFYVEVR